MRTCTFGPVVIFISRAKSIFSSDVSMATVLLCSMSIAVLVLAVAVCTATARVRADCTAPTTVAECLLSLDIRAFGEADVVFFTEDWRACVGLIVLLGVNGTFDMLLIPSFLLRF